MNRIIRISSLIFVGLFVGLFGSTAASAADFNIMPNTSSASFTSDALLESITGTTSAVTGTLQVDLASPSEARGSISVDAGSLRTGVDLRDEHLVSDQWLNAAAHPAITFTIDSVATSASALTHGQTVDVTVNGELSIKGVSRTISAPAQVTYYEISDAQVGGAYGIENNLVRVTTTFPVQLSDYGISIPGPLQAKVSNTIQVNVRLTAQQQ